MDFLIKESPFLFSFIFLMKLFINLSYLFAHEYKKFLSDFKYSAQFVGKAKYVFTINRVKFFY